MSYRRMCVSRARNDILRNATRRGWLAAKGETIEKPTNLSHPERRHHRKRDGCCWSASRKPMRASGNQLDSWSGMKSTAMWEIAADISRGELERRIAIFDTGHYKHRPTLHCTDTNSATSRHRRGAESYLCHRQKRWPGRARPLQTQTRL